jgi:predicted O-linked N-acetylglucosamine transferase (SPINDLY family)
LAQENCFEASTPLSEMRQFDKNKFHKSNSENPGRALRVGYVSYDWRDHPMGRLTSYFVTHHNSHIVTAHAFSYGPDDGSLPRYRVENGATSFVDFSRIMSDDFAADLVLQHELDIVVDLTMWTENGRVSLVNRRLAPVTINYLGYPGTSGCEGYDFVLVDRVSSPAEISRSFTEKLIYVPSSYSYQANDMPLDVAPCKVEINDFKNDKTSNGKGLLHPYTTLRKECQARINGSHTSGQ